MSFDSAHLLSQLSTLNREEGDFKLKCDGVEIKAHSYILSLRQGLQPTYNTHVHNHVLLTGHLSKTYSVKAIFQISAPC